MTILFLISYTLISLNSLLTPWDPKLYFILYFSIMQSSTSFQGNHNFFLRTWVWRSFFRYNPHSAPCCLVLGGFLIALKHIKHYQELLNILHELMYVIYITFVNVCLIIYDMRAFFVIFINMKIYWSIFRMSI